MCCLGCKAAAELITGSGLQQFYQHRQSRDPDAFYARVARADSLAPLAVLAQRWQYLDSVTDADEYLIVDTQGKRTLRLNVAGLYCASCSWLIERTITHQCQSARVHVDVGSGTVTLDVPETETSLALLVAAIAQLGYQPQPAKIGDYASRVAHQRGERLLALKRILVAGLGSMQVMTFAVATYVHGDSLPALYQRYFHLVSLLVATAVVFYSAKPFFSNALRDLQHRRMGMDVPVALAIGAAYASSVYTVLAGNNTHVYFDSAVMFTFFLSLGRFVEMQVRHRVLGAPDEVVGLLPARIRIDRCGASGRVQTLDIQPQQVAVGDRLKLNTNDIVPFDAQVLDGVAQIDESTITGEPDPVVREAGDALSAASRVVSGKVLIESRSGWADSSIARIENLLQSADRHAKEQAHWVETLSHHFVFAILTITVMVGGVWYWLDSTRIFEVCLAMLVASCPCAFSLAAPVARSASIRVLRRLGVLVSNPNALHTVRRVTLWCFDKTGTLTRGRPELVAVQRLSSLTEQQCLAIAASLEQQSDHVLSAAFQGITVSAEATNFYEETGFGVAATVGHQRFYLGQLSWVTSKLALADTSSVALLDDCVHTSIVTLGEAGYGLHAIFYLQDALRATSRDAVNWLTTQQAKTAILSGDRVSSVADVAKNLGVSAYYAQATPEQKVAILNRLHDQGEKVAMLGDGVNDAPVLAAADLSLAMSSGSDLAMSNADIVLLNGSLNQLHNLIAVANKTELITQQNKWWAIAYNGIALPVAAAGLLTPWLAAIGMSLSSLLVVLNTLRISRAVKTHKRSSFSNEDGN
ncbi:cation-transporting P-type ATPase [Arenicella chitinivorans]|uniref:Cation-transporting P-type ATPase n=2 Tax=Arenicella chitinivorans TaxID=1329800 RepID=A0A918VRR2_9GAMM|nr:cation-transporting P-type ATPase [Arenicella chitinivorans]